MARFGFLTDSNGGSTVETALVFVLAVLCIAGGTVCVMRSAGVMMRAAEVSSARDDAISLDPCVFCGNLDTGLRVADTLLDGVDWITGKIGGR